MNKLCHFGKQSKMMTIMWSCSW